MQNFELASLAKSQPASAADTLLLGGGERGGGGPHFRASSSIPANRPQSKAVAPTVNIYTATDAAARVAVVFRSTVKDSRAGRYIVSENGSRILAKETTKRMAYLCLCVWKS